MNTSQMIVMDEVNRLISIVNDLDNISIIYDYFVDQDLFVACRNQLVDLINQKRKLYEI